MLTFTQTECKALKKAAAGREGWLSARYHYPLTQQVLDLRSMRAAWSWRLCSIPAFCRVDHSCAVRWAAFVVRYVRTGCRAGLTGLTGSTMRIVRLKWMRQRCSRLGIRLSYVREEQKRWS
ncbi:MAG: hypothetical protein WC683_07025 [bacterium]